MSNPTAAERAISDLKLFNEIRDTIWEWSDEWSENAHNWLVAEVERLSQAIAAAEAAARADEREACARVAEQHRGQLAEWITASHTCTIVAKAIRARAGRGGEVKAAPD